MLAVVVAFGFGLGFDFGLLSDPVAVPLLGADDLDDDAEEEGWDGPVAVGVLVLGVWATGVAATTCALNST